MRKVNSMTKKQLLGLRKFKWDEEIKCNSIILIPGYSKEIHDSGYRFISFVPCKDGEPLGLIDGGSDVIHLSGIGGMGYNWLKKYSKCPDKIETIPWSIDCLPKSGLFQIFVHSYILITGTALSSFELFATKGDLCETIKNI